MKKIKQWLDKIPTMTFVVLIFAFAFLSLQLNIERNSPAAIAFCLPYLLCIIMLVIRILNNLKAKGSGWYRVLKFFFGYLLICTPIGLFIVLDLQFSLNGFLMIPGIVLEVGLLTWLFIRYRFKQLGNKYSAKADSNHSYSFDNLCDDLNADFEIEFSYVNVRFLFIPENGRYYFKRIVSSDPYEYEIIAEAENPLECIELSSINGRKITDLWPDVKDIEVY